jgi:transcriptional regulator with XRE-family HTH domain
MDVGTELQQARQQAGLSREQVAQNTKIQLAKIEALETGAFARLPDGIYLDGIVKAYAHAVGLDGGHMLQRVHAERALRASEAGDVGPPAATVNDAEIVHSSIDWSYADDIDSFDPEPSVAADHSPVFAAPTAEPELQISRDYFSPPSAPRRSAGRFVLTIVALLAASALGGYLYESSRRSEAGRLAEGSAVVNDPQQVDRTGGAGSETGGAGDLGAAGARRAGAPGAVGASGVKAAGSADAANDAVTAPERRVSRNVALEPRSTPAPAANAPAAPAAPGAPETPKAPVPATPAAAVSPVPPAPARPAALVPPAPPALDLSGVWTLDTRIESSTYRDFEGLQLGYRLELQQDGSRLTGTGVKLVENGRKLGNAAQTPIAIQGVVDGERLTLTFTERGLARTSGGKMILDVNDDGVLRGRFSSSAAQSAGIVEARRPGG